MGKTDISRSMRSARNSTSLGPLSMSGGQRSVRRAVSSCLTATFAFAGLSTSDGLTPMRRRPDGALVRRQIWKIETRKWKSKTSYRVAWLVNEERFNEKFETFALADSFRSELVTAARSGEAFDTVTGRPVSMSRVEATASWFSFAQEYVDMKMAACGSQDAGRNR
jgi:hypothetical protein